MGLIDGGKKVEIIPLVAFPPPKLTNLLLILQRMSKHLGIMRLFNKPFIFRHESSGCLPPRTRVKKKLQHDNSTLKNVFLHFYMFPQSFWEESSHINLP